MFTLVPSRSDILWFIVIFSFALAGLKLSIMKDRGSFSWLAEELATLE